MAKSQITLSGSDLTGDHLTVVLTVSNSKWVKTEPNGANRVFITANDVLDAGSEYRDAVSEQ